MAWGEVKVEEMRKSFAEACLEGKLSIAELCRQYEISRKNGYKWLSRYQEEGENGLKDRSRAPHLQARATEDEIVQAIVDIKLEWSKWGPKKVRAELEKRHPLISCPSNTTIGNLLTKHGLTVPRKIRNRLAARTSPLAHCEEPNDTWCMDFKGWWMTRDGKKCEPFTLTDEASRFLLRCLKLDRNNTDYVWGVLEAAFSEFGLPKFVRSDNGPPFATCGAGRLSGLSVKLIKAGVIPEWIDPGSPEQNGRHERMHQTLKNEAVMPSEFTLEEQEMKLAEFMEYFNFIRPHEALGQKTPGSVYCTSERKWNRRLKSPEYPTGFIVRKVRIGGQISWKCQNPFISHALTNEPVGLKEIENGHFEVYYGPIILGIIDTNYEFKVRKHQRRKRSSKKPKKN
jgi:transposase InsO family protein